MLNNIRMNVVQTAKNGIVNLDTIFQFAQDGNFVSANYSGGKIKQGYLVGHLIDNMLSFCYCQFRINGEIDNGSSNCTISLENGKIKLEEKFEMNTAAESAKGINIFKEL